MEMHAYKAYAQGYSFSQVESVNYSAQEAVGYALGIADRQNNRDIKTYESFKQLINNYFGVN